jgi:hypothetical protein
MPEAMRGRNDENMLGRALDADSQRESGEGNRAAGELENGVFGLSHKWFNG